MSAFPGFDNPILYAQFNVRGGWRRIGLLALGYAAAIGAFIAFTAFESRPHDRAEVLGNWLIGLLTIQVFLLGIFGTARVSAAVRADLNDRMIESHRLMPMTRQSVVIGYLLGAPIQSISLAAANLVLGLILCPLSQSVDPQRWLVSNAMIACMAFMVWAVAAQIAFSIRGGVLLMGIGALLLLANAGMAFTFVPGAALLFDPLIGHSVFRLSTAPADIATVYGIPVIAQLVIAGICVAAASRKYRSEDGIGLNARLGLLLLAAVIAISVIAIWQELNFVGRYSNWSDQEPTRFATLVLTTLIFSLIPLSSAARTNAPRLRRRIRNIVLVAAGVVAVDLITLAVHPWISPDNFLGPALIETALVVLADVVALAGLFTWCYAVRRVSWPFVLIWFGLVWMVPLVVQAAIESQSNAPADPPHISAVSPIGALNAIWRENPAFSGAGVAAQLGLMLIPVFLATARVRRSNHAQSRAIEMSLIPSPEGTALG